MTEHVFKLDVAWPGGRDSVGRLTARDLDTAISIPPEMGGPGTGTNPDEMLLGAAATCYFITLAAMIERAGLPLADMALASAITVDVTRGVFSVKRIVHRPRVRLAAGANDRDQKQLALLVMKAEERCMISNALRGNVPISVEPTLGVAG